MKKRIFVMLLLVALVACLPVRKNCDVKVGDEHYKCERVMWDDNTLFLTGCGLAGDLTIYNAVDVIMDCGE